MRSAAEQQAEAIADVERIARAYYTEAMEFAGYLSPGYEWEAQGEETREPYRVVTRCLLHADVIRVGRRPHVDRPMVGQTRMGHDSREALDDLHQPRDDRD